MKKIAIAFAAMLVALSGQAQTTAPNYILKKNIPLLVVNGSGSNTGGGSNPTVPGSLELSVSSYTFAKGAYGSEDSVQVLLQNNSTSALSFNSITSSLGFTTSSSCAYGATTDLIQPGQSCAISVSISRTYAAQFGTVSFGYGASKQVSLALSVPASDSPVNLTPSTTAVVVPAGEGSGVESSTLVIGNSNSTAVAVSSIAVTGGFTATSSCGAAPFLVPAQGSCSVSISGTSSSANSKSGTFTATSSLGQTITASVSQAKADANDGQILFSDPSYTFSEGLEYNTTSSVNIAILNQGPGSATVNSITASNGFVATYNCDGKQLPAKLAPAEQCIVSVSSTHLYEQRQGTIIISYGAGQTAIAQISDPAVTATGVLSIDNTSVVLPVSDGTMDQSTVLTLSNNSSTNVYLKSLAMADAANTFSQTNTCGTLPKVLQPGSSCTATVVAKASLQNADAIITATYNTASAVQSTISKPAAQLTFKTVQANGFKFATTSAKLNYADAQTACSYVIGAESGWTLASTAVLSSAANAITTNGFISAGFEIGESVYYWTSTEYTQSQGQYPTYRVASIGYSSSIAETINKEYPSCVKAYANLNVNSDTNASFATFTGGPVDSRIFTVTAQGQTNIGNISANVSGSGYAITTNTCQNVTLAPNATCKVTVEYSAGGVSTGELVVTSNATNPSVSIPLSGSTTPLVYKSAKYQGYALATSLTPLSHAASTMACANSINGVSGWALGSETAVYNSLNTIGGTRMQTAGMPVNSTYFGVGGAPIDWYWTATTAPQGGYRVRAVGGEGSYDTDITHTRYPGCTRIYSAGALTADTSATFSASIYGSTDSKVFTLTSYGSGLSGISASIETAGSPYSITANTCTSSLAVGATCKVTVTFTPSVATTVTNKLVIASSSEDPINISLSGTGIGTNYGANVQFLGHMDAWDGTNTKLIDEAGKLVFTRTNSPALFMAGLFGNSLYIPKNSGSTYSYLASNAVSLGSGPYTVEFWTKLEDPSNATTSNYSCPSVCTSDILGSLHSNGSGWFLRAVTNATGNGGKGYIQFYSGYNSPPVVNTPAASLTFGQWTHVVVQRDSLNDTYVYLNGVRSGPTRIGTAYGSLPIYLGASGSQFAGAPASKMVGYLDEVKITTGVARYTGTTITVPSAPYSLN